MGRRATKAEIKADFLAANPRCCFCNGERASAELDHAPARICFRQKQGPEGFVFPSCGQCNRAAAISEQVVAFLIRMMEPTSAYLDDRDIDKLISGLINNTPAALPILNAIAAARIRNELPSGTADSVEERTVIIDPCVHDYVDVFVTKMLYAIRYKVSGEFAGPKHRRWIMWAQVGTSSARYLTGRAEAFFGELQVGQRVNVELGSQFQYRHGFNAAHGYLGLWMQFGEGLMLFSVLGPGQQMATIKGGEFKRYLPMRELGLRVNKRHQGRPWKIVA
ncbi:hypothetical protein [Brevundimonas sp.]|uniref:hypothetical protein n=1 Tax=Brevundimonas sp. TaxID=1871086 RepID=UPI0025C035CB|nr:hypothetical protein [Brevundimonas sp.]MCG2665111.1 hypothetical protein [Brevundimonas sp.]